MNGTRNRRDCNGSDNDTTDKDLSSSQNQEHFDFDSSTPKIYYVILYFYFRGIHFDITDLFVSKHYFALADRIHKNSPANGVVDIKPKSLVRFSSFVHFSKLSSQLKLSFDSNEKEDDPFLTWLPLEEPNSMNSIMMYEPPEERIHSFIGSSPIAATETIQNEKIELTGKWSAFGGGERRTTKQRRGRGGEVTETHVCHHYLFGGRHKANGQQGRLPLGL
ncbi:hypothetical protein SDJN02_20844, partial [Cucurbita argyrosperma subsp. argyrosperma]